MWAFVVQQMNSEKLVYAEGFQRLAEGHEWAPPVIIRTTVALRPQSIVECPWEHNEENSRRREFCDKFDGYGGICKCKYVPHALKIQMQINNILIILRFGDIYALC